MRLRLNFATPFGASFFAPSTVTDASDTFTPLLLSMTVMTSVNSSGSFGSSLMSTYTLLVVSLYSSRSFRFKKDVDLESYPSASVDILIASFFTYVNQLEGSRSL